MKKHLLLLLLALSCQSPGEQQARKNDEAPAGETPDSTATDISAQEWKNYANRELGLSLKHPGDWLVVANTQNPEIAVINIFPKGTAQKTELPLRIHADAKLSFISIFPNGFGTELPAGRRHSIEKDTDLKLNFELEKGSEVLLLEDGQSWGYLLKPLSSGSSWPDQAFIFTQAGMANFRAECRDKKTGKQKELRDCDPLEGDEFRRYGEIKEQEKKLLLQILSSMKLQDAGEMKQALSDLIQVEKPLPNMDISSPLQIKGKARGYWFSEGVFHIRMEDTHGHLIAETTAHARGNWMTEDWVRFSSELSFDNAPSDERVYLVFEKANPSGKAENSQEYRLPVLLPPS